MWNRLKRSDIEAAERYLAARRAETLRRQAEELAGLDAEHADLEALDRLARVFSARFKKVAAPPSPIMLTRKPDLSSPPSPPPSPVPAPRPAAERHGRAAAQDRRGLSGTNFEVFSRAVSKSAF